MKARPLDERTVTALVTAATAAPSLHNAQPWHFSWRSADRTLVLRADLGRAMPRTDPDHRALHLGCGAALFNLRVAAAHEGLHTETLLLPDPSDPVLLATVRIGEAGPADHDLAELFPAIDRRHTSRHPFTDRAIPADVEKALRDAAGREGAQLVLPGAWHTEALLDHVRDAEGRDTLEPESLEDVLRWTGRGPEATDGIPDHALGPRARSGRAPVRDFAGRRHVPGRPTADFETSPHLALLGTTRDGPADWLRAGQALERILLLATLNGLATALSSHALERPDLRELARDPASDMGHVHMVLRLGYGPPGTVTPRRPLTEVLDLH
ncbi:nitroreductase [Streptomyces sp. SAI-208]|uniref:Acg family FMN-binding oxidoreductase n=1 Tax=unclassified Streptomyces TaxID=2593676 RepID=UPI002476D06B|nr:MULTISPECIES: nitroreductase [unclassified Streptomyces]MDH6514396.1 nitroreductase [Streptomyces sp. SAI-090]MDH6546576.1 nitroreductase [Streptomyces sp. SAI-041]MDH6565679.1 nitroreductase [Streptomyces sp. SAI-117]MDH6589404.1 nitroreductase [Streptomyces sp. SAI-133]MDH6605238.1 nitroreductase [Streptomyces sp. SAI-208]